MNAGNPFPGLHQSPPLRDQVYDTLERLIIDGTLEPGERLTEVDLAERLGVSRNPIREALNGLSRAGWVELRARQGAYVRSRTASEGDDFFHVRQLLEIESARLAAEHATAASVAQLRNLLDEGWAALEHPDDAVLLTANSRFHAAVVATSGNGVLVETLGVLDKRLRWYFRPVVVARAPASWQEHTDLVEAISARDAPRAAEVMRMHTQGTRSAYLAKTSEVE